MLVSKYHFLYFRTMAGTAIPVGQLTSLGFQVSFLTKEDMKVVFEGGHDGLDTEEQDGLPHQDFRVCQAVVRMFYGDLVQERLDSPRLNICMRLILDSDLLALSLMGKEGETEKECMENLETVVKLPDTVGNKFRGSEETRRVLERLSKSILLLLRTRDYSYRRKASYLLEKFCVKWGSLGDAIVYFIENYSPDLPSLEDILAEVTPLRQASVIKALAANVSGRGDLVRLFGESPSSVASKHLGVFEQLLFSNFRRSSPGLVLEICCYLSHALQQQESVGLLASCLRLWGDPVIARGYVAREVVHYARVGLALFLHMHRDVVRDNEMRLVEMLAKGLPNHFDSSDGRTVVLAKLFSELVTGTLRRMTNPKETSDSVVMPEEEICHELLLCIHECDRSEMNAFLPPISSTKEAAVGPGAGLDNEEAAGIQDSDDDSDLEPIESLSAPKDTKVKYVRDFLEGLPDMKTHSEVVDAFETLPTIVRHQLKLEHEDVAKEVLDNVFFWENEFDDAKLDLARKAALCSVVETRPEDTLTPLCLLFHQDQVSSRDVLICTLRWEDHPGFFLPYLRQ